jgi:hypothetical protein
MREPSLERGRVGRGAGGSEKPTAGRLGRGWGEGGVGESHSLSCGELSVTLVSTLVLHR